MREQKTYYKINPYKRSFLSLENSFYETVNIKNLNIYTLITLGQSNKKLIQQLVKYNNNLVKKTNFYEPTTTKYICIFL